MSFKMRSFPLRPVLLAASLGLSAVMGGAFAGDGGGPDDGDRPFRGGDPAARIAEILQLDDSQKEGVKAIFERNRPAQKKLRERGRAHWEAMKALKPGSPNYSARAQALADEAGTLARDRVLARTQLDAELAAVLTPAQMEKFMDRKDDRGPPGGRGGRHRKGEGGDAPPKPDCEGPPPEPRA